MSIKIDKDVPLPTGVAGGGSKYPWTSMEVGDSFLVVGKGASSMPTQAGFQGARLGRKFRTSRKDQNGGVRVWRVE